MGEPTVQPSDLEERLGAARFPIKTKKALVKALGGQGAVIGSRAKSVMTAEEIADLCFGEKRSFESPGEVLKTLEITSWPRAVTRALNMVYFPMLGPGTVTKLAGNVRIDGVPISDLMYRVRFPVSSTSELLEKLAKARAQTKT